MGGGSKPREAPVEWYLGLGRVQPVKLGVATTTSGEIGVGVTGVVGSAAVSTADPKACQCGEVLKGVIKPWECKVFGTACTPETPIGTCMVSSEGACAACYNFGRLHREAAVTLGRARTPRRRVHLLARSWREPQRHDTEPLGPRSGARRPRSDRHALTFGDRQVSSDQGRRRMAGLFNR
jgi:hypothetical protein